MDEENEINEAAEEKNPELKKNELQEHQEAAEEEGPTETVEEEAKEEVPAETSDEAAEEEGGKKEEGAVENRDNTRENEEDAEGSKDAEGGEGPAGNEEELEKNGFEEYSLLIRKYRDEGWNTGILEKALKSGDEEEIIWAFDEFPKAIDHLKMLRKRVEELKDFFPPGTPYRGATYEEIVERLNNPEAIPWIELEIENRERRIEEAKDALERTIDRWSAYDTSSLEREFSSVPEIYNTIREFEAGIEMLDRLRDEVEYLSNSEMLKEEDMKRINEMLFNPAAASEVEKILNSIYTREKKKGREEILKQLKEWEREGFDVSPLRAVENEDIAILRREVERFGNQLRHLKELEERLNDIDPSVGEEAEPIREMLSCVDNSREIESRLNALEQAVWKRKEELMKRARELKRKGVDVGDFELRAMNSTVAEMEERLSEFEKALEKRQKKPQQATTPERTVKRKGPASRVGELIQRREMILQKIEAWRGKGYDVSGLEAVKDQDINALEEAFNRFNEGVEKIEDIRVGIEVLPEELREEAESIMSNLNDPLNYFEAERKFLYLQEKADYASRMSELSGILKRARGTLDEVRSLELELEMTPTTQHHEDDELTPYRKRLKEWEETGYNTARLELALRTGVPELVKRMFESFERDVERLKEIEKSLDTLDTTGFKKREKQIRENLRDPEEVVTTLKHFIELEMDIRRRMKMDV